MLYMKNNTEERSLAVAPGASVAVPIKSEFSEPDEDGNTTVLSSAPDADFIARYEEAGFIQEEIE